MKLGMLTACLPSWPLERDPLWGGTETKILQGLTIAQSTLRPLILPESG